MAKKINGKGLWDTGASFSCISKSVVEKLSLQPTGFIRISTPSGISQRQTFVISVDLPNYITFEEVMVCESEIGQQGIEMLIGMDIISKGNFSLSNHEGHTVFSYAFPSFVHTDYTSGNYDLSVNI